jgi:hypothetical protein
MVTFAEAAIHEAGHVIATLGTGCLLYHCIVGNVKGVSRENSMGYVSRGTNTHDYRRSAIIGVSGLMSESLYAADDFNMTAFLDKFTVEYQYTTDMDNCKGYSIAEAAWESKRVLEKRWKHLEKLIGKLSQSQNHNRIIGAAELFQMSGCRLLDSRKLPVSKRKIQGRMNHHTEVGFHQWLAF